MAMDFWQAQRAARRKTAIFVAVFIVMAIAVAFLAEWIAREGIPEYRTYPTPLLGITFIAVTVGAAAFNYYAVGSYGGGYVARSIGAKQVNPETSDIRERQLLNVVEEMSISAAIPIPQIYIIEANAINAFAAGLTPKRAAIAVTRGALFKLNREELQSVIAHEMGHISNGDMNLNVRLAALVMGFFVVMYTGLRILQFSPGRSQNNRRGVNPVLIAALAFIAAGIISWVAGNLLRCVVSRQREYLADASSVQFTRNPEGLIGALEKIEKDQVQDMPATGGAYSHLYFDNRSLLDSLLATHPPLAKRIAAIKGLPLS